MQWTDEVYRLFGHASASPLDLKESLRYFAPESRPLLQRSMADAWRTRPALHHRDQDGVRQRHAVLGRIALQRPGG